jgi:dipeptidyl aminopeptidase/acylaminoacyl peptidase
LLITTIVACGGGSGDRPTSPDTPSSPTIPSGKPGLTLSGAINATDTINARLAQPLFVVLRDSLGQPVALKAVRFTALFSSAGQQLAVIQNPDDGKNVSSLSLLTGPDGRIAAYVSLGSLIGASGIAVQTVDAPIYKDTVRFTVLPGAPAYITSIPNDTAVAPGKSYTVKATVQDRWGNLLPQVPAYRALDASVSLSASQVVTTSTVARSGVVVSVGTKVADTAWVSVVPPGSMAIRKQNTVKVVKFDGQLVADVNVPTGSPNPGLPIPGPEWTPDGQAFYSVLGFQYDPKPGLYRIDLAGKQTVVSSCPYSSCPQDPSVIKLPAGITSFSVSPDGRTLFAAIDACNYEGILYRAQFGSTATPERLSPPDADDCFNTVHRWPSVSPDGSTLAFENDSSYFGGFTIQFMDLATRTVRPLRLGGARPRWSPLGDQVAFVNAKGVWLVRPDGTGLRRVTLSDREYLAGLTWSSDGHWLLAHAILKNWGPEVVVIEVATGMELPLGFTKVWLDADNGASVPAWRPGS